MAICLKAAFTPLMPLLCPRSTVGEQYWTSLNVRLVDVAPANGIAIRVAVLVHDWVAGFLEVLHSVLLWRVVRTTDMAAH